MAKAPRLQHEKTEPVNVMATDSSYGDAALGSNIEALKKLALALLSEVQALGNIHFPDVRRGVNFYQEVQRFEMALIQHALERTGGHQSRAARLLGLRVSTLNSMMKRYNISPDDFIPGRSSLDAVGQQYPRTSPDTPVKGYRGEANQAPRELKKASRSLAKKTASRVEQTNIGPINGDEGNSSNSPREYERQEASSTYPNN